MESADEGRLVLLADCDMVVRLVTNHLITLESVFETHASAMTQLVVARDEVAFNNQIPSEAISSATDTICCIVELAHCCLAVLHD